LQDVNKTGPEALSVSVF